MRRTQQHPTGSPQDLALSSLSDVGKPARFTHPDAGWDPTDKNSTPLPSPPPAPALGIRGQVLLGLMMLWAAVPALARARCFRPST